MVPNRYITLRNEDSPPKLWYGCLMRPNRRKSGQAHAIQQRALDASRKPGGRAAT